VWFSTSLVTDRARWMEQRLPQLKDRTLKQLALPASHDSGMYLAAWRRWADPGPVDLRPTRRRHPLLRPASKWSGGKLYITHGPITGPLLQDVLNDIKKFLSEGHKELAIFNSRLRQLSDDVYKTLVKQINDTIGAWLYKSLPAGSGSPTSPWEAISRAPEWPWWSATATTR